MGVRIGVIIALSTLASYLHMLQTLRTEALAQLQQHVSERSEREQSIFVLAEDNHAAFNKAVVERIQALQREDVSGRFDSLFVRTPNGTVRNRPEGFDGTKMVGVFVPPHVNLDAELRTRILALYDVITWYGPAFHVRFQATYVSTPEGAVVEYWPEYPTWAQDLAPDFALAETEYFRLGLPENNPRRQTAWTGIFEDSISKVWMVSVSTPLDLDGRHIATVSHDVHLNELMSRTINDHLPGAENILFREDGQLIAHPKLKLESATEAYNILRGAEHPDVAARLLGSQENAAHLRSIFERLKGHEPSQGILALPEHGEYVAVTRLRGPGWYLATVLPESMVSQPAFLAARYVLLLGILSLLLELVIMYWVLRQQITRPLLSLIQATDKVAAGDFQVGLNTSRKDELGQLARSFQLMADEVHRREEALRQANEGLEQRVEERTRELKDIHGQLVKTARQAGMAEIATNVLHNVGNVLNSVYTSAQVAKERVTGMRLEHVGRVANMLQERQGDLPTFLSQDERGRHLMPFLN
ncbi:HAMP domain-containing protein, partial [Archangium sp.]|uniref:HAMP domain-containing protein n=1 Tax=Archangium sp. TaxID=1872627 RepID=UPI002ED832D5